MGIVVEGRVAKNAGCEVSLNDRSGKSKIRCYILAMYSIHVLETQYAENPENQEESSST